MAPVAFTNTKTKVSHASDPLKGVGGYKKFQDSGPMETKNFIFVVPGVPGVISVGSGTRWWSSGV